MSEKFSTVEAYVDSLGPESRAALEEVRRTLHRAVPEAGEKISYNIPALTLDGKPVVHFAGWQKHVSLYPAPEGDADLAAAVAPYANGKGTVKFPLAEPLPHDLVRRIVTALVEQRA